MGYMTRFSLEVEGDNGLLTINEWKNRVAISTSYGSVWIFEDEVKWYEHESDMLNFSKRHPDLIFILNGVGEYDNDIWRKYFKNGKIQRALAKISFDNFDESALTDK